MKHVLACCALAAISLPARGETALPAAALEAAARACVDAVDNEECQQSFLTKNAHEYPSRDEAAAAASIFQKCRAQRLDKRDQCVDDQKAKLSSELMHRAAYFALRDLKAADVERAQAACKKLGLSGKAVRLGMTTRQVLDCGWGQPNEVNRTINRYGTHEQWVYDGGFLYLDNGLLTAIQD